MGVRKRRWVAAVNVARDSVLTAVRTTAAVRTAITAVAGVKCPHTQTEFSENFLALDANDC